MFAGVEARPSQSDDLNCFTWLLYGGAHKQVIRIAMKLMNQLHKCFGLALGSVLQSGVSCNPFEVTCRQMGAPALIAALTPDPG